MKYKNAISGRVIPPDQYNVLTAHEQRSFIPVADDDGSFMSPENETADLVEGNQDNLDNLDNSDNSDDLGADLVAGALGAIGSEIAGALENGSDASSPEVSTPDFGGFGGGDGGGGGAEGSF